MKELHTTAERREIYFRRIERLLFWSKVADFFRLKKFSARLIRKAKEYNKIAVEIS